MSGSKILFVVTGSVAAYKACEVVSRLAQGAHTVRVVMTAAAQKFVGPSTFEGLTMQPVLVDMFEPGRALDHTELTRWADVTIVCPATANTLNRMAAGLGDDLSGAMLLAHDWRKPLLVAPAMNPRMWDHPATTAARQKLAGWGVRIISPDQGRTACGDVGEGRLADPVEIVLHIEAAARRPAKTRRILVTSGGTSEPIDGVRVLTNRSTGATGAAVACRLAAAGHEVTLLRARSAAPCPCVNQVEFESHADLGNALAGLLGKGTFDAVIHAAAVSDYGVERIESEGGVVEPGAGKIGSGGRPVIKLAPLPKLIGGLRGMSPAPLTVIGFKLTNGATPEVREQRIKTLFDQSGADHVVHNDLADDRKHGDFPATIHSHAGGTPVRCASRDALADALAALLGVGSLPDL